MAPSKRDYETFVSSYLTGHPHMFVPPDHVVTARDLLQYLNQQTGCPTELIRLSSCLCPDDLLPEDENVRALVRTCGGKGGFGSMLRAIGAQIEKTTNKEACRDLSGRRLRDINQEKKLKEQLQKRAEKEKERLENRKKKFDALKEEPKHIFNDSSFYKEQENIEQSLHNSIDKGLKKVAEEVKLKAAEEVNTGASTSSDGSDGEKTVKRKNTSQQHIKQPPKKKGRFFDDLDESSEDSDDEVAEK